MKIIVQKFGGTSVSTPEKRNNVINKIKEAINKGYIPVVVVSAIGRIGDPYSTDSLLSLIGNDNIDKEEKDLLMCCGEIISAVVLSKALIINGFKNKVLTGGQAGIITNDEFGDADILNVNPSRIENLLNQGIIPIITGFQGSTENNEFTTIGRGGSDTTATVLGEALKAESIEIYTDVDGIMTADPKIVEKATVINNISYSEVFQLADEGAKVIHPKAVSYAMKGNIPIYIKNTLSDAKGTLISSTEEHISGTHPVIGIAHTANRTQICIRFDENTEDSNYIFSLLSEKNISIDLINIFPQYKAFTVDDENAEVVEKILREKEYNYTLIRNCSKVSLIGNGMKGISGVMFKVLETLNDANIRVLQTADSTMTIWCLIKGEETNKAINLLHKSFNL